MEGIILNYAEFFTYLVSLHPRRLVFNEEKMFKAEEGYLKIGRQDPLTGEQPTQVVDSDFRNRYCITGMCSMNKTKLKPVIYTIGKFALYFKEIYLK